MAKITVIPSTINPRTFTPINSITKRRVAAYARVSTDSDEQYTSYEAQVKFYTKMIKETPEWEFVKVYADEGITGTSRKRRDEFNQMISDAENGKIDLIVTKSISRFARNVLDTISLTRSLRSRGVEIYFEKENLWTLDPSIEFILTIMASVAQEESRSISQNVTVGKRWQMQAGKVSFAYKNFLGYKKENDQIVIDEEQAVIVKDIYRMFLVDGMTCTGIAERLKRSGIPTPSGKSTRWTKNSVYSILTNEKYKGDALLQKTFVVDYLEHKAKKNEGEIPQYYVENSHPAIINKDEWRQVQTEMKRREQVGAKYSANSIFSSKLVCEDCGGFYGKKKWHSTDQYVKWVYQCNRKYEKGKQKCQTPTLSEELIKGLFVKAYNIAMADKERLIADTKEIKDLLTDTRDIDLKMANFENELEIISEMVKKLINDNSKNAQSQQDYERRYNELVEKYESSKEKLDKAINEKEYKRGLALKLQGFMSRLEEADNYLLEWDNEVWQLLVESGVVHKDKSITFKFYNGKEITVK